MADGTSEVHCREHVIAVDASLARCRLRCCEQHLDSSAWRWQIEPGKGCATTIARRVCVTMDEREETFRGGFSGTAACSGGHLARSHSGRARSIGIDLVR